MRRIGAPAALPHDEPGGSMRPRRRTSLCGDVRQVAGDRWFAAALGGCPAARSAHGAWWWTGRPSRGRWAHAHRVEDGGRYRGCQETLVLSRYGARGRLRVVFRAGSGRLVPDGYLMPSGVVGTGLDRAVNPHEPGTVRAILDASLAGGRQTDRPPVEEIDGWTLFDAVAARRAPATRTG